MGRGRSRARTAGPLAASRPAAGPCRLPRRDPSPSPPPGRCRRSALPAGTGCPRPRRAGGQAPPSRGAAARGRRTAPEAAGRDEEEWTSALPALPRAPWEYTRDEPQDPAAPPPTASAEKPPWDAEPGMSWFDPFSRTSARREQDRPGEGTPVSVPAASHSQRAAAGAAAAGSHLGMPIRVPQASLAPQLRASGDDGQQAAGGAAPDIDARSPEATRNLMILMQQGWERGRVEDLDDPAGISDNGTE